MEFMKGFYLNIAITLDSKVMRSVNLIEYSIKNWVESNFSQIFRTD